MEHLTTRPTPDLEPDLLKFLNNNCGQHCEEITLTATSAGERITATKPTECISYVVGRVKIPLSGREQNWNKVNIIPHLNCLGKAISSLNRFKIGLPKDNNNRFSVKNCYSSTRSSLHYRARLDPTAIITLFNSSVAILTKWSLQSGPLWKASWR